MEIFRAILPDERATAAFGAALANRLRAGDVIGLAGPLGAGKTTLARAIIEALGGGDDAPSPTFTLVEPYETPAFTLWHFDLYRLERTEDVFELGIEEALDGVALIEWPDRIARLLPDSRLMLELALDADHRRILVDGDSQWTKRLDGLNPA